MFSFLIFFKIKEFSGEKNQKTSLMLVRIHPSCCSPVLSRQNLRVHHEMVTGKSGDVP
jgi:hypothetical protein